MSMHDHPGHSGHPGHPEHHGPHEHLIFHPASLLWPDSNTTAQSEYFVVLPGMAVSLFAVGLERCKVRENAQQVQDKQRICVSRVIRMYSEDTVRVKMPPTSICDCFVIEATYMNEIKTVEDTVTSYGKPWQLTQCCNFRVIGVPGIYRLHLNDDTAIGKVQVYAEQHDVHHLPPQLAGLFFA